ncbi:MAG: hypothetical protein JWN80_2865 [Microbacteriaceae bacterium]|nr:hypothetical protein [Microbacteriaceae bacterium]
MRVPRLTPAELDADQTALYSEITGGPRAQGPQHFALAADDGSLNGPFNALLLSPVLGRSLQALGAAVRYATALTGREREIAILIVAAHWHSAFELNSHESVGRAAGLTNAELESLKAGEVPELADARERAIAEITRAMANGDIDDDQWSRFSAQLDPSTIFELSTLVGYYATLALQLRVFRVS